MKRLHAWRRCRPVARTGALLLVLAATAAAGEELRDLSEVLEPHRERHELPALGAVIVRPEGIAALGVTGRRSLAHETPVDPTDRWHLGSVSKSMTATLAARLVDAGLITFDTTVGEVLGTQFPDMRGAYRGVTLRELLAHRGGLPSDLTELDVWAHLDIERDAPRAQRRAFLEEVLRTPPRLRPGTAHHYSNAGYVLAATMLEARSGMSWEALMAEELFTPLGLERAGIGPPGEDTERPDQPWGHRDRGGLRPMPPGPYSDHPPALAPAGRVHMSLEDLGRYLRLHLLGARGESAYLAPALFETLHRPFEGSHYALGWFVEPTPADGGRILYHEGSNTLWFAFVWIAPHAELAIAVVTNRVPDDLDSAAEITRELIELSVGAR